MRAESMNGYRTAKKGILSAVLCGGLLALAISSAQADPISFLPAGEPLQFKYNNYETQITPVNPVGQELRGIFNVSTIERDGGLPATYWVGNGVTDGTQLTGIFKGLIVTSVTAGGTTEIRFTGGEIAMYNVPHPTFNPLGGPPNTTDADLLAYACGASCGAPNPWLTANFASGIIPSDGTVTLQSIISSLSFPGTGKGTGYLDVATNSFGTGANNAFFNTNGFATPFGGRDFLLESDVAICPAPGCTGSWPVTSHDPLHTNVPEPASLLLLGIGLGGLGVWRRVKK